MEIYSVTLVFLALGAFLGGGQKSHESYIVYAVKRGSGNVFCMGGIVSSRTVLTTCSCVGKYFYDTKQDYYVFVEFDSRNSMIKTIHGETMEIEKSIVNGHCMPSQWDGERLNFNLGGWKISTSFDMDKNMMLLPPVTMDKTIKVGDIESNERVDCYVVGYLNSSNTVRVDAVTLQKDQLSCLSLYCEFVGHLRTLNCASLEENVIKGVQRCSMASQGSFDLMEGTPCYCKFDNDYYLIGITVDSFANVFLWTRVDVDPNLSFYKRVLYGGNFARPLRLSFFLALISVLNSAEQIFR